MTPAFLTPLRLEPVGRGRQWRVARTLVYRSCVEDERGITIGRISVPCGFVCDLNSLPRMVWWISPKTDYPAAGVVHDWLYRTGAVPRQIADQVYREALGVCGAGAVRRTVRFWAVRLFGGGAYQEA